MEQPLSGITYICTKYKNTKYKIQNTKKYKNTKIQKYIHIKTQKHKNTKIQKYKKIQKYMTVCGGKRKLNARMN